MEVIFAAALHQTETLIALGRQGEIIGGASRLVSTDSEWKTTVEILAEHAKSILIVPSNHEGTLWEIELLKEHNWLSKSIWIMPETISQTGFNAGVVSIVPRIYRKWGYYIYPPIWNQATEAVKKLNIELPTYENKGMIFMIDQDGKTCLFQPLALSKTSNKVRRLRKAIRDLKDPNKSSWENIHTPEKEPSQISGYIIFTLIGIALIGGGFFLGFFTGNVPGASILIGFGILFIILVIWIAMSSDSS